MSQALRFVGLYMELDQSNRNTHSAFSTWDAVFIIASVALRMERFWNYKLDHITYSNEFIFRTYAFQFMGSVTVNYIFPVHILYLLVVNVIFLYRLHKQWTLLLNIISRICNYRRGLDWWIDFLTTYRSQLQITITLLLIFTLQITQRSLLSAITSHYLVTTHGFIHGFQLPLSLTSYYKSEVKFKRISNNSRFDIFSRFSVRF
jgi:hypothetical protein